MVVQFPEKKHPSTQKCENVMAEPMPPPLAFESLRTASLSTNEQLTNAVCPSDEAVYSLIPRELTDAPPPLPALQRTMTVLATREPAVS